MASRVYMDTDSDFLKFFIISLKTFFCSSSKTVFGREWAKVLIELVIGAEPDIRINQTLESPQRHVGWKMTAENVSEKTRIKSLNWLCGRSSGGCN
jgi:hypothetical protein